MALPSTGQITMDQIADEVYGVDGKITNQSLGAMSDIAQKTAPDQMSDFYSYSQLKQGLVAYWEFEDDPATSMVDSHESEDGTVSGTPKAGETGKNNDCFRFGDTNYAYISGLQSGSQTDWSISLWVKIYLAVAANDDRIIEWPSNAFMLAALTTNELRIYDGNGWRNSGSNLSNSAFTHLVVTNSSSGWKCYFNGSVTDSASQNASVSGNLYFNANQSGSATGTWLIDEAAYWTRTLTSEDVGRLYNNGTGLFYSSF